MPDISGTIRTKTLADASISTTVGTRMYSDVLLQGATLPAITYHVIDTVAHEHLGGGIVDVAQARVQINCFAATRTAANSLADDVRRALQGTSHATTGSQYILDITMPSGEMHSIDEPDSGSDKRRYVTTQDFQVSYRTTTS